VTRVTFALSEWSFGSPLFQFHGFFSPVDNPPVLNLAKPGDGDPRACRTLTLSFRDGTTHTAMFRFEK
jgi:hypothetical protein